ncbi:sigma-70 family RNA polymerase sigma factor [Tabrizicola flagellatus]|uniref:sigma-70 family RNA polymerase sigma factor n=1 Tax=Tabrizicola flagellatus TaxID=2593021 RepID=UPI0011F1BAFA|nr:sigma-70 family RNA polymerase sigma factor [Tabrizicola flagellatus]
MTARAVVVPLVPEDPRDRLAGAIPRLRAFAISLTREVSRADDLVQDTILKAWTNMDKFDPATNLDAWLFTVLRNTFYSSLRKTRREVQDSDGVHAGALSVKPAHDSRLALQEFQRAFDKLSPEHREVLIPVGASGFSCEDAPALRANGGGSPSRRPSVAPSARSRRGAAAGPAAEGPAHR